MRPVLTLHNYIDNRAAAEELVVDAVSATDRAALGPWTAADVRNVATAIWETARAHRAAIPWFLPAGHRLPRAWAQPKRSRALSRGLHGKELLSAFQAVMGFMSTAQAELAGPLNRRAGHEGEAARMGSPAAPSHPSFAVMAKIGHDSTSHEEFQMGLEILLRGVHRPPPPPALTRSSCAS